ncbi:HIT family protein [Candidatus Fermentibacteria bacterium]|nr:HIT family protein [Candidatus Fermentibacteria bacterium]
MAACALCDIIAGRAPSHVVFEDEHTMAFLDHRPLVHGHCLVVPRIHCATLLDLPDIMVQPLFRVAKRLAWAVQEGLGAEGSFLAINTIVSQSVPHLHVHVMPRRRKDGLFSKRMIWQRRPYRGDEEVRRIQEAIRSALHAVVPPQGN